MVTFILIVSAVVLAVVWVLTIVDIVRRHYSTAKTIAWIVIILVFPFIGAIAYWVMRKPTAEEVEAAYLAETDFRGSSSPRP